MRSLYIYSVIFLISWALILPGCQPETTSGFAEVNGTNLYYEISGEGTPLVFLHGFTCDHRNWEPQAAYFSEKYRVVTYDARGHGQSSVPDTTSYSYAEDLAALMDYLNIEKAVVIGHSMGGGPVFFYAKDHPDRVLALVLAEGGAMINDPAIIDTSIIPEYFGELREAISRAQTEGLAKAKEAWLNVHPIKTSLENPVSSELVRTMINDYSGWHWFNRNPHKPQPRGTIEAMNQIKVPTLIIAGELSHPVLRDLVMAQEKYIPNARKVILKNANHMLNLENPDQFNEELEKFLQENGIN